MKIKNLYATPKYPQNNKQTKATSKTLLNSLKKRLEEVKEKWVDELPSVLWVDRMTSRKPTMATSFSLAYGMEVVLLIEIEMVTTRTIVQETRDNNANVERHLDWLDEGQKATTIWIASYHQRTIAQYNKRARE